MKVRRKYDCLFENKEQQSLIYVLFEDINGFVHYYHCDDGTQQIYEDTWATLINEGYEKFYL
jgi:hypothetical protein